MVQSSPRASTGRIAGRSRVPHTKVWRTLLAQGIYLHNVQRVQHLGTGVFAERIVFCKWFNGIRELQRYILSTDEFNRDGVNNIHNSHVWCDDNPHATVESNFQLFSVNLCCAVLDDQLISLISVEGRLTGEAYLRFLQEDLPHFWRMCV